MLHIVPNRKFPFNYVQNGNKLLNIKRSKSMQWNFCFVIRKITNGSRGDVKQVCVILPANSHDPSFTDVEHFLWVFFSTQHFTAACLSGSVRVVMCTMSELYIVSIKNQHWIVFVLFCFSFFYFFSFLFVVVIGRHAEILRFRNDKNYTMSKRKPTEVTYQLFFSSLLW